MIYTMQYYSAIKWNKEWHMPQFGWTSLTAKWKKPNTGQCFMIPLVGTYTDRKIYRDKA